MNKQLCPHHPNVDYKTAWGCPECVIELRAALAASRAECAKLIEEYLSTPSAGPVVPLNENWITMQTCIHHNDSERERAGCPVCMMNEAETLAKALEAHGYNGNPALAAFRSRHPAQKGQEP